MPLFYTNVRTGDELAEDLEGKHFASLADAHAEAIQSAREIMASRVLRGEQANHSQIEIMDSAGRLVDTVLFTAAIRPGSP